MIYEVDVTATTNKQRTRNKDSMRKDNREPSTKFVKSSEVTLSDYKGRYVHVTGPSCPEGAYVPTYEFRRLSDEDRAKYRVFAVKRNSIFIPRDDLLEDIEHWSGDNETTFSELFHIYEDDDGGIKVEKDTRIKAEVSDNIRSAIIALQEWASDRRLEMLKILPESTLKIIND